LALSVLMITTVVGASSGASLVPSAAAATATPASHAASSAGKPDLLPVYGQSPTATITSHMGKPVLQSSVNVQKNLISAKGTGYSGYSSAKAANVTALTPNVNLVILPPKSAHTPSTASPSTATCPTGGCQNPGDGYCFPGSCANLDYHNGPVMRNVQFVLDFWPGCGSSGCYNSCNGQFYYDGPGIGGVDDCHYIFLQELYFQDFCGSIGGAGLGAVIDQYQDSSGNHLTSCVDFGGSASESSGGYSVSYTYDNSGYPGNDCSGAAYSGLPSCLSGGDIQNSANTIGRDVGCSEDGVTCMVLVFTAYGEPQQGFYPGHDLQYCAYHTYDTYFQFPSFYTTVWSSQPDAYWAGGSCGAGVPSPTGDPAGDLEVSPVSHESDEAITDPQLNAFYHTDTAHEIGDECAYDFVGTQSFDGSNFHLGSTSFYDPFELQSEWSNYNGGCTLSLNGAPTFVEVTLTPDSSSGTAAQSWTFPFWYIEAGSPVFYSVTSTSVASYPSGSTIGVWQTPDEYTALVPSCGGNGCLASGSGYSFCFDVNCYFQDFYDTATYGTTTSLSYYYYEMLEQTPSMNVIDGGSPPSVDIFWSAPAPTCTSSPCNAGDGAADAYQGLYATLPISPSTADIFAVWGSSASVPTCDPSGIHLVGKILEPYCGTNFGAMPSERWDTGIVSGICLFTCSTDISVSGEFAVGSINYWNQYLDNFAYTVKDGGSPTAPTVSTTQFGKTASVTASTSGTSAWLDSGSTYSATTKLGGSTSTERWYIVSGESPGTVTGSVTVSFVYYHQYLDTFKYTIVGGGSPTAPVVKIVQFGASQSVTATTAGVLRWVDAGSAFSAPTKLIGSTATERWFTNSATGTVTGSLTKNFMYYHQYLDTFKYTIVGGGSPTAPVVKIVQFGASQSVTATTAGVLRWVDAGSTYKYTNPLGGSTSTERWVTTTATGTIAASATINPTYNHQYYVTFAVSPSGAGTVPPNSWFNAGATVSIHATANSGHTFKSWSSTNPSITFASSTSASTKMTVGGSGTVTATFT
jgi:hypothetical protein